MAALNKSALSPNAPKPVLHRMHRIPRIRPVAWSWSIWAAVELCFPFGSVIGLRQILHSKFCWLSISKRVSWEIPYRYCSLFEYVLALNLSGFRAYLRLPFTREFCNARSRLSRFHLASCALRQVLHLRCRPFGPLVSRSNSASGFRVSHVEHNRPSGVSRSGEGFAARSARLRSLRARLDRSAFFLSHALAYSASHTRHFFFNPVGVQFDGPNSVSGLRTSQLEHKGIYQS